MAAPLPREALMFFVRRPPREAIDRFVRASQELPLSYGPIGVVNGETLCRDLDEAIVTTSSLIQRVKR